MPKDKDVELQMSFKSLEQQTLQSHTSVEQQGLEVSPAGGKPEFQTDIIEDQKLQEALRLRQQCTKLRMTWV